MSKTILLGQNLTLRELYSLNLNIYVGTEILEIETVEDATKLLDLIKKVDLIVIFLEGSTQNPMPADVLNLVKTRSKLIPFLILGGQDPASPKVTHIPDLLDVVKLVKLAAKILHVSAKQMAGKDVGQFFPISTSILLEVKKSFCDIYIQKQNENGIDEYIKVLNKDEPLTDQFLEILKNHPEVQYYIPSLLRLKFTHLCTQNLIHLLDQDNLNPKEKMKVIETTTQMIRDEVTNCGLTENVINLSQTCLKTIRKTINNHEKLEGLLNNLMENRSSYAFSHCQVITYVSFFLLRNMKWGNVEYEDKISFAIFFHDILLQEGQLAEIHSAEELQQANLPAAKFELVNQHALKTSEFIAQYPFTPIGADTLIKHHHGSVSGIGFHSEMGANIGPMALIFILAEDFARRLFLLKKKPDPSIIDDIVMQMKNHFKHPKQLVMIDLLKKITF